MAAATANRLRLIQADFADQSADERRAYMAETVERSMSSLVPHEREQFLNELADMFPTWDSQVSATARAETSVTQSSTDEMELQDPGFLVTRLVEIAGSLSQLQREAIIKRLSEAGLTEVGRMDWGEEAEGRLRQSLSLKPSLGIDPSRVLDQTAMLADFINSLDQLVWRTWKTLSPQSEIRRQQTMQVLMSEFVGGNEDTARGAVNDALEKLRQLIAGLITAIGQVGHQFSARFAQQFDPTVIKGLVDMEGGSFLTAKEARYWRKYKELAAAMDESTIEADIRKAISQFAESLMKGLKR